MMEGGLSPGKIASTSEHTKGIMPLKVGTYFNPDIPWIPCMVASKLKLTINPRKQKGRTVWAFCALCESL